MKNSKQARRTASLLQSYLLQISKCIWKNCLRAYFPLTQIRIHIPSHSIFSFFIFNFFFFCPCTLDSSAQIHQSRSKCSLTTHRSHSNDRKRRNVQTLKTLYLSGAPKDKGFVSTAQITGNSGQVLRKPQQILPDMHQ